MNLKLLNEESKDGEKLKPTIKDLGHSETFPQSVKFAPSGRYFAICGDTDFVVYQYPKFANAGFGTGNELVWASAGAPGMQQNTYAVKNDSGVVKVFKNFSEHKTFKTSFSNEGIYGGRLLGIKSKDFITFYDWENFRVVRRVDVSPSPKNVYWSDANGAYLVLALEDTFYLLQYNAETVDALLARPGEESEDGFEEAFTFVEEFNETVQSGVWISNDCFVFTTHKGAIHYLITGSSPKVLKLSGCDKKYFIMGYDGKQQGGRLYLIDKSLNIVSYSLQLSLVNF
jgi:coatomer subunit beta'